MREVGVALLMLAAWTLQPAWAEEGGPEPSPAGVAFSGSYRNMLVASETMTGAREGFTLDVNRLRLEWKGQMNPALGVEIQYDNEVLLGDYLRTSQYRLESSLPRRTYWDLEGTDASGAGYVARQRIRRAAATFSRGDTDLRLGRQRIAWGTGRFWSPLDVLNPASPTSLEPGEREGVDAILLEQKRSAVSRWSLVYAPVRDHSPHLLAQWHGNARGIDYSLVGGRFDGGGLVGGDIAAQVGGAGVRAEWAIAQPQGRGLHHRLMLGWDYAFANTLTLTAEFFYDGSGRRDPAGYDTAALLAGRRQTLATRYLGLFASYELTPLLKWNNWVAVNLDDRSAYFSPRLTYSVRQNVDVVIGAQLRRGAAGTEFGVRRNLYFAWVQWYF